MLGQAIELASDELTMPEVAEILGGATGKKLRLQQMPDDQARSVLGSDFSAMFRWFEEVGFSRDIEGLPRRFGIQTTKLRDLVAKAD